MPQDLQSRIKDAQERHKLGNLPIDYAVLLLGDAAAHLAGEETRRAEADAADIDRRARAALGSLSYGEEEALGAILGALPDEGGLIVASQIGDRAGITRSVIVNALRKLESAGLINAMSCGMKGTHIKVLVPGLRDRLRDPRARRPA